MVALEHYYTGECQDLLHLLELGNPNVEQKKMIIEDLSVARFNRRIAKDLSTLSKPLYDMTKTNNRFMKSLSEAYQETNDIERKMANRKYESRTPIVHEEKYADLYKRFGNI